MEFRDPGEHTSSGYTSGSPSQPEPYTLEVIDPSDRRFAVPHFENRGMSEVDLKHEIDDNPAAPRLGWYVADTGELVIELWFSDARHFRLFASDVQEVNE